MNPAGSTLIYAATVYRGNGYGIAVDKTGNAYVTGTTDWATFPTTPDAFDTTFNGSKYYGDAFVLKLNASGTALDYSSYLGGTRDDSGTGIVLDGSGNVYVTGWTNATDFPTTPGAFQTDNHGLTDAFVTKFCERPC